MVNEKDLDQGIAALESEVESTSCGEDGGACEDHDDPGDVGLRDLGRSRETGYPGLEGNSEGGEEALGFVAEADGGIRKRRGGRGAASDGVGQPRAKGTKARPVSRT